MKIIINQKEYKFENLHEAIEKIAFEHYPLSLIYDDDKQIFSSFDEAKDYIEKKIKSVNCL